jgi:hypothetical protein
LKNAVWMDEQVAAGIECATMPAVADGKAAVAIGH